jgi:hypothetical protein
MNNLFRATAVLCGLILIAAVAYVQWHRLHPVAQPETAQKVEFQPAQGVLVDRVRFQVTKDLGPDVLSTTLPVSASVQSVPLGQFAITLPAKVNPLISSTDSDADTGNELVSATGAYLMKFSNSQLCDANGACPIALMAKSDGPDLVQNTVFSTKAKTIWVSSHQTNGNPDLIIDTGVKTLPLLRMVWSTDGQYPVYDPVPPSMNKPLPSLQ